MIFLNRKEAGRLLAESLQGYKKNPNGVVLGLARGGIVVAAEVAQELGLPLDMMAPRKIGAPGNAEFAIGAVTSEGDIFYDEETLQFYRISKEGLKEKVEQEIKEARRRMQKYRGERPPLMLKDKIVILVDDGVATGQTMRASILSARKKGAEKVVVAAPVIARDTLPLLEREADEVITVLVPEYFGAVGDFYRSFEQVDDEEAIYLLQKV